MAKIDVMPMSIRLPLRERKALDKAAEADSRAVSALARKIIAQWLAENGWLKEPAQRRSDSR